MRKRMLVILAVLLVVATVVGGVVVGQNQTETPEYPNNSALLEYSVHGTLGNYTHDSLSVIEIHNPTGRELEYDYILERNGEIIDREEGTIRRDNTLEFTFQDDVDEPGLYRYTVNGEYVGSIRYNHSLQVLGVHISERTVRPGQEVLYEIHYNNFNNVTDERDLNAKVGDSTVGGYELTVHELGTGSRNLTFTAPQEPGSYTLEMDGVNDTFTVESEQTEDTTDADGASSMVITVVAGLIAGWVFRTKD